MSNTSATTMSDSLRANLRAAANCVQANGGTSRLSSATARPLLRRGWVEAVGRRTTFGTGTRVVVYALTDAGRLALEAL